jgi:hypothetical protein
MSFIIFLVLFKTIIASPHLTYYGGSVIANIQIFPIFVGDVIYKNDLIGFYKGIVNSTYIDWLSEYSTSSQQIGRGTFIGNYSINTNILSHYDNDNDITPLLDNLIKQNIIKPNKNTWYPIHFAPGISITAFGQSSCNAFCAYHDVHDISSYYSSYKYVYYGVIPDLTSGLCSYVCGGLSAFENTCSVISHELIETITDPGVGVNGNLGWYDFDHGEIGDICAWQEGTVLGGDNVSYTVQKGWSDKQNECVTYVKSITSSSTKITSTTSTTIVSSSTSTTSTTIVSTSTKKTSTVSTSTKTTSTIIVSSSTKKTSTVSTSTKTTSTKTILSSSTKKTSTTTTVSSSTKKTSTTTIAKRLVLMTPSVLPIHSIKN